MYFFFSVPSADAWDFAREGVAQVIIIYYIIIIYIISFSLIYVISLIFVYGNMLSFVPVGFCDLNLFIKDNSALIYVLLEYFFLY